MKHFLKTLALGAVTATVLPAAFAGPLPPATITFSGFTTTETLATYGTYTESGFAFSQGTTTNGSNVFTNAAQGDPKPGISGNVAAGGSTTFDVAGSTPGTSMFQLTSFDIASSKPISFTITGLLNGVVQWTYSGTESNTQAGCVSAGAGQQCYNLITIPGFDDVDINQLDFKTISSGSPVAAGTSYFDNIVLTPTPEPASLLLLGTGLAGVGLLFYRRNKGSLKSARLT